MGDASSSRHVAMYDGETTKNVAIDYISYRLSQENLEWNSAKHTLPQHDQPRTSKIYATMRTLAGELESRYRKSFNDMCNELHITPTSAEKIFLAVTSELFNGGVQWGTIVALFAFGGCMAVQCKLIEMPVAVIDSIVDWITSYCNEKLQLWMNEHGAWDGFIEYFELDSNREWTNQVIWPSLKNFFYGVAAGALGVLTIGAIFASRS